MWRDCWWKVTESEQVGTTCQGGSAYYQLADFSLIFYLKNLIDHWFLKTVFFFKNVDFEFARWKFLVSQYKFLTWKFKINVVKSLTVISVICKFCKNFKLVMEALTSSFGGTSLGGSVQKLDGTLNVYISEVSSPTRLWIQSADSKELDKMSEDIG